MPHTWQLKGDDMYDPTDKKPKPKCKCHENKTPLMHSMHAHGFSPESRIVQTSEDARNQFALGFQEGVRTALRLAGKE